MTIQNKLLTAKQAAAYLSVSLNTLYRLIDKGTLRAYKVGGQLRIDPDDLKGYVRASVVPPPMPKETEQPRRDRPQKVDVSDIPRHYYPGMKVV